MSNMYIREYASMPMMNGNMVGVGEENGLVVDQVITFTGTAGLSAAFGVETRWVRIHVDGIASIKFGTAPTAVANTNARMVAGQTEYFGVIPGAGLKVSAVTST